MGAVAYSPAQVSFWPRRMMASSKKGVSAHQIHRTLDITYKSAWFLCHRIREAMRNTDPIPLGGIGKVIEADETYMGQPGIIIHPDKGPRRGGTHGMKKVVTLVERGGNSAVDRYGSRDG